jgi:hypothetical protein
MALSSKETIDPIVPLKPFDSPANEEGATPETAALLQHIRDTSRQMREHEAKVMELGTERRQTVTRLRELGVPWKQIAKWAGTTDGALFKHQKSAK